VVGEPKNHLEAPGFPAADPEHADARFINDEKEIFHQAPAHPLPLMLVTEDPTQNNNLFGSPKNQDVINSPHDEVGEPPFLNADELPNQSNILKSDAKESSDASHFVHSFHDTTNFPQSDEPQHHVMSLN